MHSQTLWSELAPFLLLHEIKLIRDALYVTEKFSAHETQLQVSLGRVPFLEGYESIFPWGVLRHAGERRIMCRACWIGRVHGCKKLHPTVISFRHCTSDTVTSDSA